jgi:NitT/TauT family transport system permease protein
LLAALLMVWTLAAARMPDYLLPGPLLVGRTLVQLLGASDTAFDVLATTFRVFAGLVAGGLLGVAIGLALGASRRLETLFWPWLSAIGAISSAVWAILALLWFGVSWISTAFVVSVCVMPILAVAALQGTRAVDRVWLDMGRGFGLNRLALARKVILPSLVPHLLAGLRAAFSMAWRISVVAEAMGATAGIGFRLRQAADMVRIEQVFAWAILLAALMILLEFLLLRPAERRLLAWRPPGR